MTRHSSPIKSQAERQELRQLVRQIQALVSETEALKRTGPAAALDIKVHRLERLHWQLARLARRQASRDIGNAA